MLAGWRKWLLLIGMVLGATVAALYFRPDPPPAPSPVQVGSTAVALGLKREGDHLRVVWDRRNPAIRNADHATLRITDGNQHSVIPLDAVDLANGSAVYWPESDRFSFNLDLGAAGGSAYAPATAEVIEPEVEAATEAPLPAKPVRRPPVRVVQVAKKTGLEEEVAATSAKESRMSRVVGRVPLLRRLKKHRESPPDIF